MASLEYILLIDDSDADNFYHKFVIERSNIQCTVSSAEGSIAGLEYLTNSLTLPDNKEYPTPQLMFLDINMPAMNGFELLTKYRALPDPYNRKDDMKIFMLTGSLNPDDRARATEQYADLVTGFRIKPLSEAVIKDVVREFFSN